MSDPWAPVDREWKDYIPPAREPRPFDRSILETDCPGCGRHVGAMIVDGPDPVFVDLVCPLCNHGEAVSWTERVA